jgi:hypothetical protein
MHSSVVIHAHMLSPQHGACSTVAVRAAIVPSVAHSRQCLLDTLHAFSLYGTPQCTFFSERSLHLDAFIQDVHTRGESHKQAISVMLR